jgi:hypothetical protein
MLSAMFPRPARASAGEPHRRRSRSHSSAPPYKRTRERETSLGNTLFHEAAHALPSDNSVRVELSHAALASGLANDLDLGTAGQLSRLLKEPNTISRSGEPPRTI